MKFYQNKNNGKLILAQQWNGSKKTYKYLHKYYLDSNDGFTYVLPDSDLSNITYFNHHLVILDDDLINISVPKRYYREHIKQIIHLGDYIIYWGNSNSEVMRYTKINKADFDKNYQLYPITKPTSKYCYIILRITTGSPSSSTTTPVLILGSKKQGQKLTKFINKLANNPEYEDYYTLFKMPNNNNLNFMAITR